jgi:hypothetical protein
MTFGAKAAIFVSALVAAIVLGAGPRIASARAAGPPQPTDLAAEITAYANSEVDSAMAQSAAAVSQVADVELQAASTTMSTDAQTPSPPAADIPSPSSSIADPLNSVGSEPTVVVLAAPQPTPPVPLTDAGGWPLDAGPVLQHDLKRSAQKAKPKSVVRASHTAISRSTSLRVELRTSATASGQTSSSLARTMARSTVRSSEQSSTSGGRSERPAVPKAPLPFPPFPPNAPAPNSGVSPTGGGGGQGALLLFFVPLAVLVIFGIHRLLRKVHWSDLRMPRRGAVLPWRPG